MHTQTDTPTGVRRFVDPDDLVCPGCGDPAIGALPAFWSADDGLPVAQFSHPDRTPLCRNLVGEIVEPVEVTQ